MEGWVVFIVVFFCWFALQAYILPWHGVTAWLRQSCQVVRKQDKDPKISEKKYGCDR